jgi:hypothetical protein
VSFVGFDTFRSLSVPEPDGRVLRHGEDKLRVWREFDMRATNSSCVRQLEGAGCGTSVPYGIVIVYEGFEALTRLSIPETSTEEI